MTSQQRYLPFGGERTDVGEISETDYGFTGQRNNSYINLMDYRFRWYSPALARFISPDSIVPNLANPQSLNRYAYVLDNPIRYNDPTGHAWDDCGNRSGYQCRIHMRHVAREQAQFFEDKFGEFFTEAERIAKNKGKKDTLEAMARIVESAVEIFNGDWNDIMQALGLVFIGTSRSGPGTLIEADNLAGAGNLSSYYLGGYFKDAGFNGAYQDGGNQIGHVWGFIANTTVIQGTSYHRDAANFGASAANNYHEFTEKGSGGSRQDFLLSLAGMRIGKQVSNGEISSYELGDVLRTNLGESAVVDNGFVWQYWFLPDAQAQP